MGRTTKIIFSDEELEFIKTNFYSITHDQLLSAINSMRETPVRLPGLLHTCRRLGLRQGIQIRWSIEDIEFLKANYKTHGYTELAIMLNERKSTFRIINGKKVFRIFTKKHVEKKQELLGLKHTNEETYKVRVRNNQIFNLGYTYENNDWSLGYRTAFPENEIRIWGRSDRRYKYIKINGRFIHLHKYNWEKVNGPVPINKILTSRSGDALDCDPENWELTDRAGCLDKSIGRDELTDTYILSKLTHMSPELKPFLREMPELISLKRSQIKLKRTINELTETTTND